MADEIIGSLGIQIVGDYSSLASTLAAAQSQAAASGASIASAFNTAISPSVQKATVLFDAYGVAIKSAAASTASFTAATSAAAQASGNAVVGASAASSAIAAVGKQAQGTSQEINGLAASINSFRRNIVFPLLGINAAINIAKELGETIYNVYEKNRDAPEKIAGAFGDLNQGLDATNDTLTLTDDKIQETLAHLNSTPANTLKTAIDQDVVSADHLRSSLTSAVDALYKTAAEQGPDWVTRTLTGMWAAASGFVTGTLAKGIIGGAAGALSGAGAVRQNNLLLQSSQESLGGQTGQGGFRGEEAQAFAALIPKLREAKTAQEALDAQKQISIHIGQLYNAQIAEQQSLLSRAPAGSTSQEIIQAKIADLQKQQYDREVQERAEADQAQATSIEKARAAAAEKASIALAYLANETAASKQQADVQRKLADEGVEAAHQQRTADIASIENAHERAIATAKEEIQYSQERRTADEAAYQAQFDAFAAFQKRKADLVSAGKTPNEATVARAGVAGETAAAAAQLAEQFVALDDKVATSKQHLTTVIAEESRKEIDEANKFWAEEESKAQEWLKQQEEAFKRVTEIREKAAGNQAAAGFQSQRIAAQTAYGAQPIHTAQTDIAQAQLLLSIDQQDRAAKLAAAEAEAATAQAALKLDDSMRNQVDAATKLAAAQKLAADNANANLQEQGAITDKLAQQTLQYQLQADFAKAFGNAENAIGPAIAQGVFGSHKQGENVGAQIEKALKNVGQQLFGSLITTAIKQLVTQLAATTAVQTVLHAIGITQATALTANTAAVAANTAALAAQATASGGGGVASALEGLAGFGLFAGGGDPPVGVASIVGENGPELFIPHSAGTIIPAGQFASGTGGPGALGLPSISGVAAGSSAHVGEMHFHAHGMTDSKTFIDQVMREIPGKLKSIGGPAFSPLSR